jgi:LacI family transcriptional regulator
MASHPDAAAASPSPPTGPRPQSGRRATIQDVARAAGVSVSAVSKVLRDAYGVSPQMRTRVKAAIDDLGYRPHTGARAMRGRTYTVGVMLNALTAPFQVEVAQSISEDLVGTGFQDIVVAGGGVVQRQKRAIEALIDRQVDGLVLVAPFISAEWLEELGTSIPLVVVARHGAAVNFDTVIDDDRHGARLLVDHLVGLGHRRILHVSHSPEGLQRPSVLSQTARCDGFMEAMKRHGLEPDVIETSYTEEGGYAAAEEALGRPSPPTAIFAGADIAALGVLHAAEERGLRVPDDLSVAGYDDIHLSSIGRISLTTVNQSAQLTGATSIRLLLERIGGRTQSVHHVIAPRLEIRNTTSRPSPRTTERPVAEEIAGDVPALGPAGTAHA